MKKYALMWFRDDLRLQDNPALLWLLRTKAAQDNVQLLCIYIDEKNEGCRSLGAAARWWKLGSLAELSKNCQRVGLGPLLVFQGCSLTVFSELLAQGNLAYVAWNRRYHPAEAMVDKKIKTTLRMAGCNVKSFAASLLQEPWQTLKEDGTPFKVFSPFWKKLKPLCEQSISALTINNEQQALDDLLCRLSSASSRTVSGAVAFKNALPGGLADLHYRPSIGWDAEFFEVWQPGEDAAKLHFAKFLQNDLPAYGSRRDFPAEKGTSRLSAAIRFGEISVQRIWIQALASGAPQAQIEGFLRQVAWRDFSHLSLFYNADLHTEPLRAEFRKFPFRNDRQDFKRWTKGTTGYPLIDAGMQELWRTGYMHNRVRMVAASFLVKHLLLPWQWGEQWFWDTLVDACPANNPFSWQWVAGCGLDAAPYFRVFNPSLQAQKFDANGAYVRRFLKPTQDTSAAQPLVSHEEGRDRALKAFQSLKLSTG